MPKFITAKNGDAANNWPICWTGQDNSGDHWNVTTNNIPASQLHTLTAGAQADAELIARLLNEYYAAAGPN